MNGKEQDDGSPPESWRLPAGTIEQLVVDRLCDLLLQPARLAEELACSALVADQLNALLAGARRLGERIRRASTRVVHTIIRELVHRITIASDSIQIDLDRPCLLSAIDPRQSRADHDGADPGTLSLIIPVRLKRRGSELKLVVCDRPQSIQMDRALLNNLARGYAWLEELQTGAARSLGAIADREGISAGLVRRHLELAFLPTDIIESILAGQQPIGLTTEMVKCCYPLPTAWEAQRQALGCG